MKRTLKKVVSKVLIIAMLMATIFTEGVTVSAGTDVTDSAGEITNKCTNAVIVSDTTSYSNLVSNSEVGTVVKLTTDCTLNAGTMINLTANETITLDLNGKTIQGSIGNDNQGVFTVSNGVLNIVDTSDSKLGSIYNAYNDGPNGSGIYQNGGTVNFYSGTILAPGQAFNLDGGTFNMYGGQLIGIGGAASTQCEALTASDGTFNIYAGYLIGASTDFWKGGTATGNLQGGYYSDDSVLDTATVAAGYTFEALSSSVTISTIKGEYTLGNWVYLTSTSGISLKIQAMSHLADQLTAKFMDGSTEKFLTASYTWQRSSDGSSWSDIDGATNKYYTVGSIDEGKKLRVFAKIGTKELWSNTSTVTVVYPNELVNGSFEYPEIKNPSSWSVYHTLTAEEKVNFGWTKTVDKSQILEFGGDWNVTQWGIKFIPEGRQFIELNADEQSAIYQDLSTTPGTVLYWSLYQGGVWYSTSTDIDNTMAVKIGTPDQLNTRDTMISTELTFAQPWTNRTIYKLDSMTAISSIPSAYNDKDLDKKKLYTEPKRWTKYEGIYVVPEGQTVTRFVFASLSEESLSGNLLDGVVFKEAVNNTAEASANTSTPTVGEDNAITLTVKDILGITDTNFDGAKNVTITGVGEAPNGTYGSFNGTALDASSAGAGQTVSVTFTGGVATPNLKLNKADEQTIGFSIATITTQAASSLTITPTHGAAASMAVTQNITAPASNGGNFAQQPKVTLKDAYENICTSDNTTVVTAAKEDAGTWTLTGTKTATANNGVATFTNLGATNTALVSNAQLGFTSGVLTRITSNAVNLPAPTPTPAPTPQPLPETSKEQIIVDITDGQSDNAIAKTLIERTTEKDGTKKDSVTYEADKAKETIDKLIEQGKDTVRLIVPDKKDEVSEARINIPKGALSALGQNNIKLEISTENVMISIPKESVKEQDQKSNEDIYFRVVPIKEESQRKEILEKAKQQPVVIQAVSSNNLEVVGRPMTIETNMKDEDVDIILPLKDAVIPMDLKEREAYLSSLEIYIEHSDGEKVLKKGEVVDLGNGLLGIKFRINKFSTFSIVKLDKRLAVDEIKPVKKVFLVATNLSYADAYAGEVLAKKLGAQIIKVGANDKDLQSFIQNVVQNYTINDQIFILGGKLAANINLENQLKAKGFNSITRIGGVDLYETAKKISEKIAPKKGMPVILVNGSLLRGYSDSISKVAAEKGYAILFVTKNSLTNYTLSALANIAPSKIYIAGTSNHISNSVILELKKKLKINAQSIVRIKSANDIK